MYRLCYREIFDGNGFNFKCVHLQRWNNRTGWICNMFIVWYWHLQNTSGICFMHGMWNREILSSDGFCYECVHLQCWDDGR